MPNWIIAILILLSIFGGGYLFMRFTDWIINRLDKK